MPWQHELFGTDSAAVDSGQALNVTDSFSKELMLLLSCAHCRFNRFNCLLETVFAAIDCICFVVGMVDWLVGWLDALMVG